jgi:hypothetical protein
VKSPGRRDYAISLLLTTYGQSNDSTREISPLRQRLLEDMRLRKLAPHTQASYVRAVRRLAGGLFAAPELAVKAAPDSHFSLLARPSSEPPLIFRRHTAENAPTKIEKCNINYDPRRHSEYISRCEQVIVVATIQNFSRKETHI